MDLIPPLFTTSLAPQTACEAVHYNVLIFLDGRYMCAQQQRNLHVYMTNQAFTPESWQFQATTEGCMNNVSSVTESWR